MRVHELAKKLDVSSKALVGTLKRMGADVKNHMSTVDEDLARKLLSEGEKKPIGEPAKEKKPIRKTAAKKETKKVPEKIVKPDAVQPQGPEELPKKETPAKPPSVSSAKPIEISMPLTVGDLAKQLRVPVATLIKALMGIGIFANINQVLDEKIVFRAAEALNIPVTKADRAEDKTERVGANDARDHASDLLPRPPVVTLMGHVDHGKTSLLDVIRKTNVVAGEAGQITQHMGAYEVDRGSGKFITFLDTPGHAAFTAMRARGAMITDIVVLVVAADDGVKPQTIEAIDHAKEAGCPIVVAINKSDLPHANLDRVRQQLQKHDIVAEDWGGKTIMVPVSAKTGRGIDDLLESLLLEAEVLELKANPRRRVQGFVVEGRLSKGEGPTATVIIRQGTLRVGDPVISGPFYGRVRALRNNLDAHLKQAAPAQAVEVLGLNGVPDAADDFQVVDSLAEGRRLSDERKQVLRDQQLGQGRQKHLTLDDLHTKITEGKIKDLKIVLKADTQGSLEALSQSLLKLSNSQVHLHTIHSATGNINESDVMLAAASDAIVIGFHVKLATEATSTAIDKEGIDVRMYDIIYDAVNDVTKALEGLLDPTFKEIITGKTEIRKIFTSSKVGTIAGAYVLKGNVGRTNRVRIFRAGQVVYEGKFSALKRFKDDVKEVREGFECGMSFVNFNDLRERDIVESFRLEKVAGKLV